MRCDSVGVAGRQRRDQGVGVCGLRVDVALGDIVRTIVPQSIQLVIDRWCRQSVACEGQHPVQISAGKDGHESLAAAGTECRAAPQRERDVAAEARRELDEFRAVDVELPESCQRDESCRGVGAATRHATRYRDAFDDVDRDRGLPADVLTESDGRACSKVGVVDRNVGDIARAGTPAAVPGHGHTQRCRRGDGDIVEDRERLEHGHEIVIAVGTQRSDAEVQVDLRGHPHTHGVGHDRQRRRRHNVPA